MWYAWQRELSFRERIESFDKTFSSSSSVRTKWECVKIAREKDVKIASDNWNCSENDCEWDLENIDYEIYKMFSSFKEDEIDEGKYSLSFLLIAFFISSSFDK